MKTIVLVLVAAFSLFASDDISTILSKIETKGLSTKFNLDIYWSIREKKESKKGKLILKGDNFRFSLGKSEWVSNGVVFWQYSQKNNQVVIRNFLDIDYSMLPASIFERFENKKFKKIEDNGKTLYRWSDSTDLEYNRIDVELTDDKSKFTSILFVDKDDNRSTYTFSDMKYLDSVDENIFEFVPPKDAEIFDER